MPIWVYDDKIKCKKPVPSAKEDKRIIGGKTRTVRSWRQRIEGLEARCYTKTIQLNATPRGELLLDGRDARVVRAENIERCQTEITAILIGIGDMNPDGTLNRLAPPVSLEGR